MSVPVRVLSALFLGASLFTGADTARAEKKEPWVNGRTIKEWVEEFHGPDEKKAKNAASNLRKARYIVDAAEIAVPAFVAVLGKKKSTLTFTALTRIAEYGPTAARAATALKGLDYGERLDGKVLVARIMIGDDAKDCLGRLLAGMKSAKKALPRKATRRRSYKLLNLMTSAGRLGVRGDDIAKFIGRMWTAKAPFSEDDLLGIALDLGPAAAPLATKIAKSLGHSDEVVRWRALMALAHNPDLPGGLAKKLFKGAEALGRQGLKMMVLEVVAVRQHGSRKERLAYFKGFLDNDRERPWALAGLARVTPQDADVLDGLKELMESQYSSSRLPGVDGTMALGNPPAELVPALKSAGEDHDMRVRWRAAVALYRAGEAPDAALTELARTLEGPDDLERIAVLETIAQLGSVAKPLEPKIEPWTKVPYKRLSDPARKALTSVRKK